MPQWLIAIFLSLGEEAIKALFSAGANDPSADPVSRDAVRRLVPAKTSSEAAVDIIKVLYGKAR